MKSSYKRWVPGMKEYEKDILLVIRNRRIVGEIKGEMNLIARLGDHKKFNTYFNVEDENESIALTKKVKRNKTILFSTEYKQVLKAWDIEHRSGACTLFVEEFEGSKEIQEYINMKKLLLYYL